MIQFYFQKFMLWIQKVYNDEILYNQVEPEITSLSSLKETHINTSR